MLQAIAKLRGRLLPYLGGCGSSSSWSVVSAEERAARKTARRNAARRSAFAKFDEVPTWVRTDPNLAEAWARARLLTIVETPAQRRRRLRARQDQGGVVS